VPEAASPVDRDAGPTIRSVQRATRLLTAFSVSRPALTLAELSAAVGTSKATTHRHTKALRESGLLAFDERTGTFTLASAVIGLGAAARAAVPLLATAESFLTALSSTVQQTVLMSIFDGESVTVARCVEAQGRPVRVTVAEGIRLEPATSAQGRLFCAYLPPGAVALNHAVRNDAGFSALMDAIRAQGLSISSPNVDGVRSVAAPVFDADRIVATMAVIGTVSAVGVEPDGEVAREVSAAAAALSTRLGAPPTVGLRTAR
jgi:DNA-binding IclR family transcriptional regulator